MTTEGTNKALAWYTEQLRELAYMRGHDTGGLSLEDVLDLVQRDNERTDNALHNHRLPQDDQQQGR